MIEEIVLVRGLVGGSFHCCKCLGRYESTTCGRRKRKKDLEKHSCQPTYDYAVTIISEGQKRTLNSGYSWLFLAVCQDQMDWIRIDIEEIKV